MAAAAIIPLINLGISIAPQIPALVADFKAIFAKYPALANQDPAVQAAVMQLVLQATLAADADTEKLVHDDQAAHPFVPSPATAVTT